MPAAKTIVNGEKECGLCKEWKPVSDFNACAYAASGYRSRCKACMCSERSNLKDHYKEWRQKDSTKEYYRDYRKKNYDPKKAKARNRVKTAVSNGTLVRPERCETCGRKGPVEGHHDDYDKPLEVRWLCSACHRAWHKEHGEARNGV